MPEMPPVERLHVHYLGAPDLGLSHHPEHDLCLHTAATTSEPGWHSRPVGIPYLSRQRLE